MKKCGALLLFLLCLCECGVQGEREWVPTMEQRLTRLEARLSAVVSSMDHEAEADLREYYEKKMDGLAKQNEELQSRLDSSENITQVLQSRLDSSENIAQVLQSRLDSSENITQVLQSNVETLTKQIEDMASRLSASEAKMGDFQMTESARRRKDRLCETDGFTWDSGVCYYLSKPAETKTWDESRQFCTARQAYLIVINSQEKQDLFERVAPISTSMWIGLSDRDTEGSFEWVDGTPLTSPTFWRSGRPDDSRGDQDCVYYWNGGSVRGWWDFTCSYSLRWMCERVVQ